MSNAATASPCRDLVIDTNVVLDWLAFGNPIGGPLEAALRSGRWRWVFTRAMRDELDHVIARPALAHWRIDAARIDAAWSAWAVELSLPKPLGAHQHLPCTDPDDQKFIDLAVASRAAALLSRDRAVLKLASRARRLGLTICTPEAWLASSDSPTAA